MAGRLPDYSVNVLSKKTEQRGKIGGAWLNEDKSITVVLDMLVIVPSDKDLLITLFPRKEEK